MRFASILAAARTPAKEPVPFQEIVPLKLKQTVSGKGDNTSEVSCIYEMSVMFACFKANEFSQDLCSTEVDAFQKCYRGHLKVTGLRKQKQAKGILTPGEKNLSSKQLNVLLKRYPNIK